MPRLQVRPPTCTRTPARAVCNLSLVRSKTALLEGLEVDQYMLGILIYVQK